MNRKPSAKKAARKKYAYKHPGNFFVPIVEKAKHSVISIRARTDNGYVRRPLNAFLYSFLFPEEEEDNPEENLGTGFIIHPGGYILTSEHVIHNADQINVKLYNGRRVRARVVLRDERRDWSVIKIPVSTPLRPLPLGSSALSKVGEMVISIGNPLGLDHTITTGVISAKNRQIRIANTNKQYEDIIQTDCAINPGNSGGPLINLYGQVIGMNAFVVKDNQGLGFSIGIDSIKKRIAPYLPK